MSRFQFHAYWGYVIKMYVIKLCKHDNKGKDIAICYILAGATAGHLNRFAKQHTWRQVGVASGSTIRTLRKVR